MKSFFVGCSLFVVSGVSSFAAATNAVVVTSELVEALVAEARTNHPALRAADVRADAAVWNASAVRTWEDPVARVGVGAASREMRREEGDVLFGLEQKLPLFGKPQAEREVAQSEAVVQRREAAFRAQQVRASLHKQLLKLALAERLVELGRLDLAEVETLITTTEDRYRNGLATQVEVLTSQNERARRANAVRSDEALLTAERASLDRLLGRTNATAWPKLLLPRPITKMPGIEDMVRHSIEMAPQLEVMRASVRQAEALVKLAHKQRLPDVSVGVETRQYSGSGEFREGMVLLGLTLPWGNRSRYASGVKREERRLEAAQLDIADMQFAMRDEITRMTLGIENAQREAELYRTDILPRTRQALESAHAAWLNNRGMLREVLEARRMLLDAQVMEARAIAEQHTMLAELILNCGLDELHEVAR
jgi:outer membrane protein, heavy metal efflux system